MAERTNWLTLTLLPTNASKEMQVKSWTTHKHPRHPSILVQTIWRHGFTSLSNPFQVASPQCWVNITVWNMQFFLVISRRLMDQPLDLLLDNQSHSFLSLTLVRLKECAFRMEHGSEYPLHSRWKCALFTQLFFPSPQLIYLFRSCLGQFGHPLRSCYSRHGEFRAFPRPISFSYTLEKKVRVRNWYQPWSYVEHGKILV